MPRGIPRALPFLFVAVVLLGDVAAAQTPPIRIASIVLADRDGRTSSGRRYRRPFVPRANEQAFMLVVIENVTQQTQPYSLGTNYNGSGVHGGSSGTTNPMLRTLLPDGGGLYSPGHQTVVVTLCTEESYPCGDGMDDEVYDQVTFEFDVRE